MLQQAKKAANCLVNLIIHNDKRIELQGVTVNVISLL